MTQDRCLPFDGCPAVEVGDNSYDSLLSCRGGCMGECLWVIVHMIFHSYEVFINN